MFDWAAAGDLLHRISKRQLGQFLSGPDAGDVYGIGFFCDAHAGTVYLAADTEQYHLSTVGQTDSDVFRWDIGNWKYPGGLFPSSSSEQQDFDAAWEEYRLLLSEMENDNNQGKLEALCFDVLSRLVNEGAFAGVPGLKGFTVLGPDSVVEKWKRLDG